MDSKRLRHGSRLPDLGDALDLLIEADMAHAAIDLDCPSMMHPMQGQHTERLMLAYLVSVRPVYAAGGAERLVVAWVVEDTTAGSVAPSTPKLPAGHRCLGDVTYVLTVGVGGVAGCAITYFLGKDGFPVRPGGLVEENPSAHV